MKKKSLFLVFLLSGCGQLSPSSITEGIKLCDGLDNIDHFFIQALKQRVTIYCTNGMRYTIDDDRT